MHPMNQSISLLNASDPWFNVSRIGKDAMLDLHEAPNWSSNNNAQSRSAALPSSHLAAKPAGRDFLMELEFGRSWCGDYAFAGEAGIITRRTTGEILTHEEFR